MALFDQLLSGGYATPQSPFMRLAGDIVPMYNLLDRNEIYRRLMQQPGGFAGSRGAGSINTFGGPQSPTLDLLNILSFPGGRQMAPSLGRPRGMLNKSRDYGPPPEGSDET